MLVFGAVTYGNLSRISSTVLAFSERAAPENFINSHYDVGLNGHYDVGFRRRMENSREERRRMATAPWASDCDVTRRIIDVS